MKENGLGQVSSTEKTNTKRNLGRATTKSKSGCRQSLMDVLVKGVMNHVCEGNTAMKPLLTRSSLKQMSWRGYGLASTLTQWLSSVYNNQ